MTEEMREPTSTPESPETVNDLAAKEIDAEEQSSVTGGLKSNIQSTREKSSDATIQKIG